MAKPRTVLFINTGEHRVVDAAFLRKYPLLKRLPTVTEIAHRTTSWQIQPSQLADLTYTGARVQVGHDGSLGLTPEDVRVGKGKVIEVGNEIWTSDLALLQGRVMSEAEARKRHEVPAWTERTKVYLNGKRKSARYYLCAQVRGWPTLAGKARRERRLKALFGVDSLPRHWEDFSEADLREHFALLARAGRGELARPADAKVPFRFLDPGVISAVLQKLFPQALRDPLGGESFYATPLDMGKMRTQEFVSWAFNRMYFNPVFLMWLVVYLHNQMGGEFLEILADELREKHKVDFHEFM